MNSVERTKELLRQRGISLHKAEMDLGFGNGYIGQLKKGTFPDDRLKKIADYLGVSTEYLATVEEAKYSISNAELIADVIGDVRLMEALKKYMALSDEKKNHVLEMINLLSAE